MRFKKILRSPTSTNHSLNGETVSVRLKGTKLASSRNRLMILPINSRRTLLTRQHFLVFIEDLLAD